MILKGNQRAGGDDLATHLMNEFDNERIEVAQIRGTVADHLHGAFGEYEALASGTRCTEPLYSLSINPSAPISREQYYTAIDRIEQRLGLSGQARAVVFHVKHGREHAHVVWCRIDTAKMRAVPLSHDRQKLRSLARELAHEFGLPLPEGLAQDRGADRARKKEATLAEKAQADETGITPGQRRAEITEAYRRSDSAEAFRAALKEKGYVLATGDKRVYVVVDRFGKVHSLARQIDGVRTAS
jgi:MobA/VirD2-like, nuclease domain